MATDARPSDYSPQLDGLRAVSVVAVAYSHWLPAWQLGLPLGAGVHLFFVLSGFLITRILLACRDRPQRGAAVARFYVRRVRRLFPAFYLVLATAWLANVPLVRDTWPWHAAYLSNLRIALDGRWMGHVSHLWSLAVEEQFYLLWPWLIVWAPRRWLAPLLGVAVMVGPVTRCAAAASGLGESFWALVPGGSADSLALGALVALGAWRSPNRRASGAPQWPGASLVTAAALGWCALAAADALGLHLAMAIVVWRQLLQGIVFAWLVGHAVSGFGGPAGRLLAHRWSVALGRISYGVYLIHPFAPLVLASALGAVGLGMFVPVHPLWRAAAALITTVGLAAAMWRLVERPLRQR
ncbi:MAG: acyltransferase [Acidobacteriota bacterium]